MKSVSLTCCLIITVILLSLSCRENSTSVNPTTGRGDLPPLQKQVVESTNRFGFNLVRTIDVSAGKTNIFISPLSISMCLGMALNGASGTTLDSMQQTLQLQGLTNQEINDSYKNLSDLLTSLDPSVAFKIANSIWYRTGFSVDTDFVHTNQTYFNALVQSLDFSDPSAASTINTWVDQSTHGKITGIVDPPIPADIVMYLINAVYFKGSWTYRFDSTKTVNETFTTPDGSQKPVPMMKQSTKYLYYENNDLQMVDLPYGVGDFRMTVVLPKSGVDIDQLISTTDAQTWSGWIANLDSMPGDLSFPKFTLEYKLTMNDVLKSLGMAIAFVPGSADFTRINPNRGLYISNVEHKSFVEVNEEGTEAAAVTEIGIGVVVVGPGGHKTFSMDVNHPFLLVIRDAPSGTLLFIGKIVDPS